MSIVTDIKNLATKPEYNQNICKALAGLSVASSGKTSRSLFAFLLLARDAMIDLFSHCNLIYLNCV